MRRKLDSHSLGRRIGISFDEWNVWYAWYRHPGIVDGVHNAFFLNRLCREAEKLGVTLACFFQPVNEGAIVVEPFRAYLPAGGQIFTLLKAHAGNALLEAASPDGSGDVDVTASCDTKTNQLVLTLVNLHPAAAATVTLRTQNASIANLEGVLLEAPDFLPGTDFTARALSLPCRENKFVLSLPKHSVASLTGRIAK